MKVPDTVEVVSYQVTEIISQQIKTHTHFFPRAVQLLG
jgi:hypothetical protein